MLENMKYFWGSLIVTLLGFGAAFWYWGVEGLFIVVVLSVLEVSLSFDNAVVNATVLKEMNALWRRRFLTWGIVIAVFGMRIIFPVMVVSIAAGVSPWEAMTIAVYDQDQYKTHMDAAHVSVMAFGGAFLMMVGLDFFFDDEKKHWIPFIETPMVHLGKLKFAAEVVTVAFILIVGLMILPENERLSFLFPGIAGIITFTTVHLLTGYLEKREKARAAEHAAKSGAAMFLYLELLDASFSFDGVIGAFAITNHIFIIAIGLGIGAMFVRSLTILLVEKGTLAVYVYLEHGAFYAIVALASIMFIKTIPGMHIPDVVTGLIGAGFIVVAFLHSLHEKKK